MTQKNENNEVGRNILKNIKQKTKKYFIFLKRELKINVEQTN